VDRPRLTEWGEGQAVLLVHGSIAAGAEAFEALRPLGGDEFALRVIDRRGYGRQRATRGEDFLADADDIAALLGDGSHVVAHSYGAIGALLAAARRPDAVRSLALVEPPLFALAPDDPAAAALLADLRRLWAGREAAGDREFLVAFLDVMGADARAIPDDLLDAWTALGGRALREGRPSWEAEIPAAQLTAAAFPKVVFSGGHSAAFDAACDALAERIGARRQVIAGAGHAVAASGEPFNRALLALWRSAAGGAPRPPAERRT
jgi:pimeloyl-ACP methyl ester carboxylesterase